MEFYRPVVFPACTACVSHKVCVNYSSISTTVRHLLHQIVTPLQCAPFFASASLFPHLGQRTIRSATLALGVVFFFLTVSAIFLHSPVLLVAVEMLPKSHAKLSAEPTEPPQLDGKEVNREAVS